MPRIALATNREFPTLSDDDRLVVARLAALGIRAEPVIWDDPDAEWRSFDAVIVRSCWDYHLRLGAFMAWIDDLQRLAVPLWNPAPIVRWNADKTYLRDLAARGAAIPPTVWLAPGAAPDLQDVMVAHGWDEAVIKPAVSAAAHNTYRVSRQDAPGFQARLRAILASSGALVQQFMPAITDGGEWSFIFFGKRYSHTIRKRPQAGDYRVQIMYGGTWAAASPPAHLLAQAQSIVDGIQSPLLYSRVDGVAMNGTLVLLELELIEPYLFLGDVPDAPDHFAVAIAGLFSAG